MKLNIKLIRAIENIFAYFDYLTKYQKTYFPLTYSTGDDSEGPRARTSEDEHKASARVIRLKVVTQSGTGRAWTAGCSEDSSTDGTAQRETHCRKGRGTSKREGISQAEVMGIICAKSHYLPESQICIPLDPQ